MKNKILKTFFDNPLINSLVNTTNNIVAPSLLEEAIIISSHFLKNKQKILVVKHNLYNAQKLYEYLLYFLDEEYVSNFFFDETLRIEALASSKELLIERLNTLNLSLKNKAMIIVTHTLAYTKHLSNEKKFIKQIKTIKKDQIINKEELVRNLVATGYYKVNKVRGTLDFSKRGAIIDFFPVNYKNPVRIEFFDDVVESIRFFDINSQRTIQFIEEIEFFPANELILENKIYFSKVDPLLKEAAKILNKSTLKELEDTIYQDIDDLINKTNNSALIKYYSLFEETSTISDYFKPDTTVLIDDVLIKESFDFLEKELLEYQEELFLLGKSLYNLKSYQDLNEVYNKDKNKLIFKTMFQNKTDLSLNLRSVNSYYNNNNLLIKDLKEMLKEGKQIYVFLNNENQIESFNLILNENQITSNNIKVIKGHLIQGFEIPYKKEVYLSSKEIYGVNKFIGKYFNKYKTSKEIENLEDLNQGDFLVHDNYGIGLYKGLKTIKSYNSIKDYIHLEYRNNETLYLPLEQFFLIRKYTGSEGKEPRLNKLGSNEWENTKNKIKNRVRELAIDLISLYEQRSKRIGFSFSKDDELQKRFENAFIYEPTPDQTNAIKQIKKEMEKDTPMDALLCGDVGFGKTEVAFVAAYKAIQDNKQVAFLCPTTLLSNQHFSNALERFLDFGVNIELLNRFKTVKEQKETIDKLKEGKIDLLIGTHRILSKDVKFKDLGLLIVDEEQRFGVEHKEKIKEIKNEIDVLTLSATPIPRTMQMALLGVRTLIDLKTAPNNRMPVQTYVIDKDFKVIKEIIERELARGGQVFYLYNRTSDINAVANKIKEAIPEAKVGIIHGQMDKQLIEETSFSYYNNKLNVLVCTTIIETGIDVGNANTIIVEDAPNFGLAQLYQIKGRVGRGDRLAYAYLLINSRKRISETAQKRLKAIKEFSELGSGHKIALRDLSIRGAGDIVGAKQAGFIDNVGMDLYIDLLKEAIEEEKGVNQKIEKEMTKIVQSEGYIPKTYSELDSNKIAIYKKLETVKTLENLIKLKEEIEDLYGKIPQTVDLLIEKKKSEILLSSGIVEEVKELKERIDIIFSKEFSNKDSIGVNLFEIINKIDFDNIILSFLNGNIRIRISKKNTNWLKYINRIFDELKNINMM